MMSPRVLIAAGGTGGHVFPALAVARELVRQGWHAEWVGSDRGLEARVVPNAGIGLHILRFTGLRGKGLRAWLSLPVRLIRAVREAHQIVGRARPEVVVAFGGYVTFPVGLVASLLRIPLCVHEQNAVMGSANRWLSRLAQRVMVSFPSTRYAPRSAAVIGNPVREEIHALADPAERYGHRTGPLKVLVVGGSLGAAALNASLPGLFAEAIRHGQPLLIQHQTGPQGLDAVIAEYRRLNVGAVCTAFIQDMDAAYRDADLVICRAGASTVTEVAAAGVAALFIPLPNAIDDHQSANARTLVDQSAAWMIPQGQLGSQEMARWLAGISRSDLMERACKARGHAMHGAARRAAEMVGSIHRCGPLGGSL
jgi:UDP-N-acetylglucosamine--N-acetylmuramyl-(pentapeptide) pyrophosphoryl-undecaprenol N-acetylglucosamine transferase